MTWGAGLPQTDGTGGAPCRGERLPGVRLQPGDGRHGRRAATAAAQPPARPWRAATSAASPMAITHSTPSQRQPTAAGCTGTYAPPAAWRSCPLWPPTAGSWTRRPPRRQFPSMCARTAARSGRRRNLPPRPQPPTPWSPARTANPTPTPLRTSPRTTPYPSPLRSPPL